MTRPDSLFEAASYDLNKFRERRMADRRFMARDTPDRRKAQPVEGTAQQAGIPDKTDDLQTSSQGENSPS